MSQANRKPRQRGRPTDDPSQDLREALLDAAEELFSEQGFSAVPVRAVAERAGVNPALVHYYFGSKQKLLLAVMDRAFEPLAAAVAGLREAGGADAPTIARLLLTLGREHPRLPRLIAREVMLTRGPLQDHFIEHYAPRLGGAMPGLIERAKARGTVAADADPPVLALLLMGLALFPWIGRDIAGPVLGLDYDGDAPERIEAQVERLLQQGVAP